ncbi:MAG: glycosyltransferase [Bacteroidota bacterium]
MIGRKKIFVSVSNDLYTDNRVNKVCHFLCEQGYEVVLVGRKRKNSQVLAPRPYQTKRFRLLFDKGPLFYAALNVRLFFFLLFKKVDILLSNDLDTLPANYLASKFKRNTRLVYDTHEYFTEVPELIARPKVRKIWLGIEKRIFPKLETIYTVNQSIANKYQVRYGKKVHIVRNVGPKWIPIEIKSRASLGLPEDQFLVILQGSGINVDRGAEEAIEAIQEIENAVLVFVGDGDVIPSLKKEVVAKKLEKKVLFFGKRPYEEMMQYTHACDIGLSLDKPLSENYLYSLPNKIFDYIQAGTPIICTNLPEVSAVVTRYDVGLVLPKMDVHSLTIALKSLQEHPERRIQLQENCKKAAEIENWEAECEVLSHIYPKINS